MTIKKIKSVINKSCYFLQWKKWKDSADFWHRKLTLKTQNLQFAMPNFKFNSIKPPFDAEVAENFLHGLYCLYGKYVSSKEQLGIVSREMKNEKITVALSICTWFLKNRVSNFFLKSSWMNLIFRLFRTWFLVYFELDF